MGKCTEKAANKYRYERKFIVSGLSPDQMVTAIKLHPAMFREIYHRRCVNNIYFDTFEMKSYYENVDGESNRTKTRIRWYGDLLASIEKPVLELKIKRGCLGTKKSYVLKPFSMNSDLNASTIKQVFSSSDIPDALKMRLVLLQPTLVNRYERLYYQAADGHCRLTLDSYMEFYSVNNYQNSFLHKCSDMNNLVLELKYDRGKDGLVDNIAQQFPVRMTKNSKYLNGVDCLVL
ncbi:polyphosphate polymerase domain-containing protein [Planctomycetota bacterium]